MVEQSIALPRKNTPNASAAWLAIWSHRWFVLGRAGGIAGWQGARLLLGPAVVVDQVQRGNLVETVVASGHVETPFRVEIGSQITGTVEDVLVQEGQQVSKGQRLISLESRAESGRRAGAGRGRPGRGADAPARRTDPALGARSADPGAGQPAQRAADLRSHLDPGKDGFATRAALDDAQKNLDVARTQVRTAEFQVYTASTDGSDYVMAQTQLNQARANLDTASSRLGYATIAAPRDGVLITRNVERGTVVQPGKALLVLAPAGETQLVLQIDERNLGKIALGQNALASADAYPDQRFDAVVSYINPGIDITRASVEVKLVVPDPPDYLRQDMTVSVDIEVAANSALVLPVRDVHDALSGEPWVLGVKTAAPSNGRFGSACAATDVEILDGMAEGDVAIPVTAGLLTGQRLRPVRP